MFVQTMWGKAPGEILEDWGKGLGTVPYLVAIMVIIGFGRSGA